MRVLSKCLLCLTLSGATGAGFAQAPVPAQAVFRAGVDVIQLDVLVLDRNRRPVHGLTASDFTVLERGKPQPVVAFTEVNVPAPVEVPAEWVRDVGPDVTSNDLQTRRLILLILDDGNTGVDEAEPRLVRQVATKIIDSLGPNDLAAVVFSESGRQQNFTNDRAQLLKAIDSFQPRNWGAAGQGLRCTLREGGCALNTLASITDVLRAAPPGRKAIMYIGPGMTFDSSLKDLDGPTILPQIKQTIQRAQQSNASIYTFDPRGVRPSVLAPEGRTEIALAEVTGGRAIRSTNDPAAHVAEIFRENSSDHLLGYQSTDSARDGRFRKIEVTINRPGLEVKTRSGYYATQPERPRGAPSASALDTAVLRGMPSGDLPLRMAATPLRVGRNRAEVAIVVAVSEPGFSPPPGTRSDATAVRRVNVVATAFDANWRSVGAYRQTLQLTMKPVGAGEVSEYRGRVSAGTEAGTLRGAVRSGERRTRRQRFRQSRCARLRQREGLPLGRARRARARSNQRSGKPLEGTRASRPDERARVPAERPRGLARARLPGGAGGPPAGDSHRNRRR